MDPFDPGRQPSGRTPAPGRLGLIQAFANSFWDLDAGGADEWRDAPAHARWLHARGFDGHEATEADRARAIALREALRRMALAHHDTPDAPPPAADLAILDDVALRAPLRLRFGGGDGDGGPPRHVAATAGPDAALGLVLGVVAEAMTDGRWSRMKACPGPHCGWLFYDGSRNRSRQWCSMQICGNRVKGREFRARRRQDGHLRET